MTKFHPFVIHGVAIAAFVVHIVLHARGERRREQHRLLRRAARRECLTTTRKDTL